MRGPARPPSMPGMERPPIALGRRGPPAPRGFTAIELMVVVAILAILAALAAPSFTPLIERWRVRQANEALQSSLYFARSEAIKRGGRVVIKRLPNNTNACSTLISLDDWDCGWLVCDTTANASCSPNGAVLQRYDTPAKVQISRPNGGETIIFDRWGAVSGTYVGFSIVPYGKNTSDPATLGTCVTSGGRIRTTPPEDTPCSG